MQAKTHRNYTRKLFNTLTNKEINMYTILVVNENRYLINTMVSDLSQDKACETILQDYPDDAEIHFEIPTKEDLQ